MVIFSRAEQKLSLEELLRFFFKIHNPTQGMRQGPDEGDQYRSLIVVSTPRDEKTAHTILEETQGEWKDPLTTEIRLGDPFYRAQEAHQHDCKK